MTGYEVRPDEETVPLLGARVTIVDAAALLTAAEAGPVELLAGAGFPAPVREVRCTVRADAGVHCFEAYLRVDGPGQTVGLLALGLAGPAGLLLAQRLAAYTDDDRPRRRAERRHHPAHLLPAMVGVVLQAVRELAGDTPEPTVLRGRSYTVGRRVALATPAARR